MLPSTDHALGEQLAGQLHQRDVTVRPVDPNLLWEAGQRRRRRTRLALSGSGTAACLAVLIAVLVVSSSSSGLQPTGPAAAAPSGSVGSAPASPSSTVDTSSAAAPQNVSPDLVIGAGYGFAALPDGYVITDSGGGENTGPASPTSRNADAPIGAVILVKEGALPLSVRAQRGLGFTPIPTEPAAGQVLVQVADMPAVFTATTGGYSLRWLPAADTQLIVSMDLRAAATAPPTVPESEAEQTLLSVAKSLVPNGS